MFRAYSVKLDNTGTGEVNIMPNNRAVEWDIYQISVKTNIFVTACQAAIYQNGFLRCASPQGSLDTATGPPDIVLPSTEKVTIEWINGSPGDTAQAAVWYNENPAGTTVSMAH